MERGICPIAAVCTVLLSVLSRSRDPGHANVLRTFARGHVATIPGTRLPNWKFVSLAVSELLAFNAQKFTGSRDRDHAHFSETFVRVMSGLSLGTRLPNLKFVPSAVLELLAFNAQKFTGSRDPDHAHFSETFVRGHVGTIPGNTPDKFEVRIFNHFGAISV